MRERGTVHCGVITDSCACAAASQVKNTRRCQFFDIPDSILLIHEHSSHKYRLKSAVKLSFENIASVCLISSVLWVPVGCTSAENCVGLFSWDAPLDIFNSITLPFPNAGEALFKQMGNWD